MVRVPEWFLKDLLGDGNHRHVLNVWIVLNGVADDVVRVVVGLPPAHGEAHQGRPAVHGVRGIGMPENATQKCHSCQR